MLLLKAFEGTKVRGYEITLVFVNTNFIGSQ